MPTDTSKASGSSSVDMAADVGTPKIRVPGPKAFVAKVWFSACSKIGQLFQCQPSEGIRNLTLAEYL